MRSVGELIHVHVHHGQPAALYWQARRYPVNTVLDTWRWAGRWWLHDPPRDYWLLEAGITAEIYRTRTAGQLNWVLARIAD
ncbi:DUF6504 family protein [Deinococcus antarcticus]|uniref:DUF6504 family protein n=1 Tax=Deinococcus antarcticus TaxID=1298767 RepID=A0ABV8A8C2_9DEIO